MTTRSERVAWPQLMRLGLQQLGLAPDVFWNLTPAELMLMAGVSDAPGGLSRSGLAELEARFPDMRRTDRTDLE